MRNMSTPINCTDSELFIFLQGVAEGFLPTFYSDTNQFAPSKSMTIASKSYQQGKKTVHFPGFQFSMTLQNSTVDRGEESLMSLRADSPAKIFPAPEKGRVLTGTGQAFGTKCSVSFGRFDPDTFSLKTAQCSWLEDLMSSSVDLPIAGTMFNGQLFQQVPLEQDISATGFGVSPDGETFATPTTMDSLPPKSEKALLREMTVARPGRSKPANLRDQVSNMDNWKMFPTPKATDGDKGTRTLDGAIKEFERGKNIDLGMIVKMWPTPRAQEPGRTTEGYGCGLAELVEGKEQRQQKNLNDAVTKFPTPCATMSKGSSTAALTRKDGKDRTNDRLDHFVGDTAAARLNPGWVCWLMMWPKGWVNLEPLPENAFDWCYPCDEPFDVPRVTSGCDNRAAKLKAIGNGQVSLCAATAFKLLMDRFN